MLPGAIDEASCGVAPPTVDEACTVAFKGAADELPCTPTDKEGCTDMFMEVKEAFG